ncbi:patatin-like phospholipase family protein [Undibacterium parvum]|uniref:patatin-like phospholipase family protein n=1 Tax=Undibacterium parvum TaxID=401471 RepID=UPI0014776D82|nr:patatin-like phospholipase family protein [Undibacterium parvum]
MTFKSLRCFRLPITIALLALTGLQTSVLALDAASTTLKAPATLEQSEQVTKRPKICLVLSGGGARGAAHVGVLKVLEELRVPIHCIAGTSMGALVGASYATGSSIAEMEDIIDSISTELLFKETPPRTEQAMRRKQDDYTILFGPELGVTGDGIKLPKGVVSGVQLETVLRQLSKSKGYHQFDKLPIPFRAVATDLVSGKAVVFSEGELANVMRASMSVPGAVAPAEFGGMMLVDGMLTSNLPVASARAMGADIVIAVNVGTPLLKRESITSILGVTGQMLSILTEQNVQASLASLKSSDVLISPDLGDFSTSDFDHLTKIIPTGEVAARLLTERLSQLSLPTEEYAALRQRQLAEAVPDVRHVDEIRFENLKKVNPIAAKAEMETRQGQAIDQAVLDKDMRRLYGTGNFEHVNYRFMDETDKRVLAVDAIEKSWGPDYLRFGLGLSSDFKGSAYFNVLASYRKTWINSLGAEWRSDVQFGHINSAYSEFYQPLNAQRDYFVAPHIGIQRSTSSLFLGRDAIATFDTVTSGAGLLVGSQFSQYAEIRAGVQVGSVRQTKDIGPPDLVLSENRVKEGAFTARLLFDQLDSVVFPRSGVYSRLQLYNTNAVLKSDQRYTKWDLDANAAYSFGSHTFNVGGRAAGTLGSGELPAYNQISMGGFLNQSGYANGQFLVDSLSFARVMYYHRLWKGSILEGAYGGGSLEIGRYGKPLVAGNPQNQILRSGSIFVGTDTPIGAAYLSYGHALDGSSSLYFFLGKPF